MRFSLVLFGLVNDTEASVFGYSVFTHFRSTTTANLTYLGYILNLQTTILNKACTSRYVNKALSLLFQDLPSTKLITSFLGLTSEQVDSTQLKRKPAL